MKPEHSYYDIKELVQRWSEYEVKEKDLLKYGANGQLQFSIILGPKSYEYRILIVQSHHDDSNSSICNIKPILYGQRTLFDLNAVTISDLLFSSDSNRVIARLTPQCKECSCNSSNCKNIWTHALYDTLSEFISPLGLQYPRDYEDLIVPCNKDDLVIRSDEVLKFEKSFDSINTGFNITEIKKTEDQKDSAATFISNLTIRYEDNKTISIQEPGTASKEISASSLGFILSKENKGITWEAFLEVLQDFPEYYFQLRSKDKKVKDKRKGLLKTINKKLLDYFIENYDFDPPEGYKLWERVKGNGSGLYKFEFKISIKKDKNSSSANSFKRKFNAKVKEFNKTKDQKVASEIQELAAEGFGEDFLTKKEVEEALAGQKSQSKQNTPKGVKPEYFKDGFQIKNK